MTQQFRSWARIQTRILEDACTPCSQQRCSQPQCPSTDKGIEMWYTHVMESYSAIEKNRVCHL